MIDFLDMDSNKMVISEFYENDKAGKYEYSAVYQREKVWSEEKKSFLIDSILKNYPIPPVFFRMKIDPDTGITKYDVIDGKQRLTTIRDFIDGKIVLPDDFGDDRIGNSELNGASFVDLDQYEKYKKQFWRYRIPVIFIETDDVELIKNVFDRLNRNGEPLMPQELRHAQYGETSLYRIIDELAEQSNWKEIYERVLEIDRMEDKEFVSELIFLQLVRKIIPYTKETLDELYKKWSDSIDDNSKQLHINIVNYIAKFDLNYITYRIGKVSHLYTIWVVGLLGYEQNIDPTKLGGLLNMFYGEYLSKSENEWVQEYKKGMSSATKGTTSRKKRINALLGYCAAHGVQIDMNFN